MYTALSWLELPSLTAEITLGREKIFLATVVSSGKHTAWPNSVVKVLYMGYAPSLKDPKN